MTMQQSHEHDVFNAVSAIEQRRVAAGYEICDLLELIAVKEGGTDPVAIWGTLASIESETSYQTIKHCLSDPKANKLLADYEAVREMAKCIPFDGADGLLEILGSVVEGTRKTLTSDDIRREVFQLYELFY